MDLYSASRRIQDPFVFADQEICGLPIGARGMIGDGFSCALVRVDGAIDWLCMPRFDSPSVFGALLDKGKGGITWIRPVSRPFRSLQRYDPDTNVLETLFQVDGQGVVRLTDFMPWTDDPRSAIHEVHRRIQCLEGTVHLEILFDPRFDYGRAHTSVSVHQDGVLASSQQGETMVAVVDDDTLWAPRPEGGVRLNVEMRAGQRKWMVLSWDAPGPAPIAAYRPFEHLRQTRHRWREWASKLDYDGPWRHHVLRSALALKLLIYAPTGAMVAAPTASLPEWPGGRRNWDYRYVWTRDAAMAIRAANLVGYEREAREFFHYMRDALSHREGLQVMYDLDGHVVPAEETLEHLSGFAGSQPVRIGNGARDQLQLDTAGALVDAGWLYERFGGSLTLRAWRQLRRVIDAVRLQWRTPDHGMWEPRGETQHNVHSKLMCWLALDRGQKLALLFGDGEESKRWALAATEVRSDLMANGLDPNGGHFGASYARRNADAALLMIPIHGFLEANDPIVQKTVSRITSELGSNEFLYRYHVDDGVNGPEGAFILCGFWLAEVCAMAGDLERAQAVFLKHAEASNHLGLLSEEIDPTSGILLGNFPQAFSHLGLINAAARIDRALRLRDAGSKKVAHLVGDD